MPINKIRKTGGDVINEEKSILDNVYLAHIAKDGWNDIQGYHIENVNLWRFIAIISIIALMVVSTAAMYMINQDKHKTLVFERDNLGNLSALGIATKTMDIDNKIIAHQLANFIIAIREVPHDITLKRRNINMVHKMSDIKLHDKLDKMFIERYTNVREGEVLVILDSIKPLEGNKSWEVSWHEEIQGAVIKSAVSNWSTIVSFKLLNTLDVGTQLINPTGMFITHFHPVQDITDKS